MSARAAVAVAALAAVVGVACGDDGGDAGGAATASSSSVTASGPAAAAPAAGTVACDGCRTVAPGRAMQFGTVSLGVTRCDGAGCEVVIADADGAGRELDVVVGDELAVGDGWVVVATGRGGLVIRRAG